MLKQCAASILLAEKRTHAEAVEKLAFDGIAMPLPARCRQHVRVVTMTVLLNSK